MDFLIEEVVKELKKINNVKLTQKDKNKIYKNFPIPKEHKILWADTIGKSMKYGMVITDIGLFLRTNPTVIKKNNKEVKKEEKLVNNYYYFKWEYFNLEDFELKKNSENEYEVLFNGKKILEINGEINFFRCYEDVYNKIIKEATISAENIFADLEAVIPENFARVNSKHGHGEMAEEALNILDKLKGNEAEVVGRTNQKNGADRIVNDLEIQTKYYSSGKGCVNACFDKTTGQFRYQKLNGKPMLIEVPKDKYIEAVNEFRKKILENKVPGVTNPDDASKYVKKGQLTYKQALNLCKPGTIESLKYDVTTGAINCSFALGISFLTTFIFAYSKNNNKIEAMQYAIASGVQVFGLSFFAHILTQQVARTELTKQLIPLSNYIAQKMGYKTVQTIVNSIRTMAGKTAISGTVAMKQLSKIFRNNVVSSIITLVVFSVPDTYNLLKKRLSAAQYTKNMLSLVGTIATAGSGTVAASVAATKIGAVTGTTIAPGIGTAIGIAGGLAGGVAGGVAIKALGDYIKEDDTVILSRLFNAVVENLIYEYMLSESEINELIKELNTITAKEFKELFTVVMAIRKQEKIIEDYLRHYFEKIIRKRPVLPAPKPEDIIGFFEQFENDNKLNNEEKNPN